MAILNFILLSVYVFSCGVSDKFDISFLATSEPHTKIILLKSPSGVQRTIEDDNGYASAYLALAHIYKNNAGVFDFESDKKMRDFLVRNVKTSQKHFATMLKKDLSKKTTDGKTAAQVLDEINKNYEEIDKILQKRGKQNLDEIVKKLDAIEFELDELDMPIKYRSASVSRNGTRSSPWMQEFSKLDIPKPNNLIFRGCNLSTNSFNLVLQAPTEENILPGQSISR